MRTVDELVRSQQNLGLRVREVHPEVSFRAMASRPLASKHTAEGQAQRLELVAEAFGPSAYVDAWTQLGERKSLRKDLLDAFACLWTARRIQQGTALSLPAEPETDSAGLPMAIWY
jgi:predicted RNase H-like nuclease